MRSPGARSCRSCSSPCCSAWRRCRSARPSRRSSLLDQAGKTLFAIVGIIMRLAPIGAFGAMAFTVGRYGIGSLISLGQLMAGMYVTCLLFVFIVLGAIARAVGFRI